MQTGLGDKDAIWQEILDLKEKITKVKCQIQPLKQSVKDLKVRVFLFLLLLLLREIVLLDNITTISTIITDNMDSVDIMDIPVTKAPTVTTVTLDTTVMVLMDIMDIMDMVDFKTKEKDLRFLNVIERKRKLNS
jgi:hypothetical protein